MNPRLREELTPEMRAEYARRNQENEIARKNAQAKALATYQKSQIWTKYHKNLTAEHRAWWRTQGIPDRWQDFWQLGYRPSLAINKTTHRVAYTIPKFDLVGVPVNMDYRIIDPPTEYGKYRPIRGLPVAPFISNPRMLDFDEVCIVEGSKKAMVLTCHNIMPESNLAIGIPSCNSWAGVEKIARKWETTVWVMLDHGAEKWAYRLATAIGKHAIVVELPEKPDNMVLAGATRQDFMALMNAAEAKHVLARPTQPNTEHRG